MNTEHDLTKYRFLTTYNKSYVKKPIRLVSKMSNRQEFADPIGEGFRHYLVLDEADCAPPNENAEAYLEKFKQKYEGVGKVYFEEPLQKEVIFRNKITKGLVSEYQMNYCDVVKDLEFYKERAKRRATIRDDAKIPLTTHTASYKDPTLLSTTALQKSLIIIAKDHLGTSDSVKKVFDKVDISEYSDQIGRLGEFIIRHNVHGHLNKLSLSCGTLI